jgi:hypothetical protein
MTPNEDHSEFEAMRLRGASPEEVFLAAERTRDRFAAIRVVRALYSLSLPAAKEIMVRARESASSLTEYQAALLPALKLALTDDVQHSRQHRDA